MSRMKPPFWSLNFPAPGGVKKKNRRKNMKFWPLNPYYKRSDWKTWLAESFSEAQHLSFKIKKKPNAKACRNGAKLNYVHPSMVSSKIFDRSIYVIATWNSREKIKWIIPHEQNHTPWLVKNSKTVFSKLTWQISLSVSGEQANRQANTSRLAFLSQIFIYFLIF